MSLEVQPQWPQQMHSVSTAGSKGLLFFHSELLDLKEKRLQFR